MRRDISLYNYRSEGNFRLGIFKMSTVGLGCFGLFLLATFAYFTSVAFWSWVIMLVAGAAAPGWHWGFFHAMTPWGLIAPFLLG